MKDKQDLSIVFSKKAQHEINSSWIWYEDKQQGLGDRFVDEVMNGIERIQNNPFHYAIRIKSFRETCLRSFPFLIIFRINEGKGIVRIISVFHTARNPHRKFKA